jgi:transposase
VSELCFVFLTAVMEQRANIKFCVKMGKMTTKTYEMLRTVYGDEVLSRSSVYEWFKRYKDGHEEDDPRSGHPSTTRNADTIANGREMVTRIVDWLSE